MRDLYLRAIRSAVFGTMALAALIFVPAGTLDYWQGWAYLAVVVGYTALITLYLALYDPKLLERRMRAGPTAERKTTQRVAMVFAIAGFIGLVVVSALDHRFGWSSMPPAISIIGDALVALGFLLIFIVLRQNSYAAATIQIAEEQKVISTGFYAIVRHPMYAGALPMLVGTPLALGSWWGLLALIIFMPALIWRLLDEERFLEKNLPGYTDYSQKVRWRMIPGIF
jgi:protein-S-isoprenylcysteine O-methyltransferase Ste14